MKNKIQILASLIFSVLFCCCSPLTTRDQSIRDKFHRLSYEQTHGQTFLSRYRGLQSIEMFIQSVDNPSGDIHLNLYNHPFDRKIITQSVIKGDSLEKSGFISFPIPIQKSSFNTAYYLEIYTDDYPDDYQTIKIASASGNAYLNGSMYQNGAPIDSQLSFRLVYNFTEAIFGILIEIITWLFYLLVSIFLFILPGWAIMRLLIWRVSKHYWEEKIAFACAVSLAIYPILFLWSDVFGIKAGHFLAWLPASLALAYLSFINRSRIIKYFSNITLHRSIYNYINFEFISNPQLILVILLALVIFSRFWVIRNLNVPMWGDSYQHTVITQLLVDNKGLFYSWSPYADIDSFTYHFGFHSLVATFHWITGVDIPLAVLWVGQILNVLAILAIAPLSIRISNNRWSACIAILISGLLSHMPMFYTNWGRYTQLTGQIILPTIICLCLLYSGDQITNKYKWKEHIPFWILFCGLALTHYRLLLLILFFPLVHIISELKTKKYVFLTRNYLVNGVISFLIFSPWFYRLFEGRLMTFLGKRLATPSMQLSSNIKLVNSIGDLTVYLSTMLWISLVFFLLVAFWQKKRIIIILASWWGLMFLATNPNLIFLPGEGLITNFALFLMTYIFTGAIISGLIGQIIDYIIPNRSILSTSMVIIVLIVGGIWGTGQRIRDLKPQIYALMTKPDMVSFDWIKNNTPTNAKFLVNSFLAYNQNAAVGSDSGWWLTYFTNRKTNLRPLNYMMEKNKNLQLIQNAKEISNAVNTLTLSDPNVLDLLQQSDITHVYVGQLQGKVNHPGTPINPQTLTNNPNFDLVYQQDRIYIFEINYP